MTFHPDVEASFNHNLFAAPLRWPHLKAYQHVLIEPEIVEFAFKCYETVEWDRCLTDARPLADRTLFYVANEERSGVLPVEITNSNGWCKLWVLQGSERRFCGRFQPGGIYDLAKADERYRFAALLQFLSLIVALTNQPRFVVYENAVSRQQRRRLARQFGLSQMSVERVRWNVGEPVKHQIRTESPDRCLPLHFRRGHWRRAAAHFSGAVQRPDALIEAEQSLWWQWIAETWVGHPAFGFKATVHTPSLGRFKELFDGA